MKPAEQIAAWADKLRDISATALLFTQNPYDREHLQQVQDVAVAMMALASGESLEELEPLRTPIFSRPTPLAVGDAAVIDESGRILLVKRADNGKWAMPGGALEVGETPAEEVVREALEETGVHCRAVALVGVFDSRLCGTISRRHLYHLVFLCTPSVGLDRVAASHSQEVLDTGWFREDELPETMDPGHVSGIPEVFRVWRNKGGAFFDTQVCAR
jgi:ADP-ribose pyrophosphatase YjhB (NUDIX family)